MKDWLWIGALIGSLIGVIGVFVNAGAYQDPDATGAGGARADNNDKGGDNA